MNLLGNAIKFTPKDGSIELGAHLAGGRVRVEVRDNGPGHPPPNSNVFEASIAFVNLARKTKHGDCSHHPPLVELHGGESLWIANSVRKVASISLPLAWRSR